MAIKVIVHRSKRKVHDAFENEQALLNEQRQDLTKISSRLSAISGAKNVNPGYRKAAKKAEDLIDQARDLLFRARPE